ncbi:phosphotransferase family protein [Haladaptatus sp. NG-SE-30]
MDDHIASVLDRSFPDRDVEEVGPTGPSWNDKNRTVRIDFADGQTIFLKVAIDGDGSRIARERAVISHVGANCEVPVPTVVASDTDWDVPYFATAPMSGQSFIASWSDASMDERAALARQVGTALAAVHTLRFEEHGHITGGDEEGLELETGPWTDILIEKIEEARSFASSDRFDHHFDEVIAAVEANRELLDEAPAALLHGDPAQPNCYDTETGIGFLDWEIAHVGDPVRDIYRTQSQQFDSLRSEGPEPIVTSFYDGYRERAGGLPDGFEDRRPVYEAVRFLGNSGYVDKLAEYVDEPPEELAEWIQTEMTRLLAEIR